MKCRIVMDVLRIALTVIPDAMTLAKHTWLQGQREKKNMNKEQSGLFSQEI